MSTYLVTGGAGFIGSHLCDALVRRGDIVRILDNLSTGSRDNLPSSTTLIEADVTDSEAVSAALRDANGCFHLAAIASSLPEGWQPGGVGQAALAVAAAEAKAPAPARPAPAPGSFAAGFRQAVADHLARKNGTAPPEDPTFPTCASCGQEFEPTASDDYCEACLREGGAL